MPDMGRGITAPAVGENIVTGAAEMQTLGSTAATAIDDLDAETSQALGAKADKSELDAIRWTKGTLPAGNVSSVYSPGQYLTLGANNYQGLPDVLDGNSGLLTVYANGGRTWGYQEYVHYGSNPSRWWRVSNDLSGSWNPWTEVTPTSAPGPGQVDADAGLRHQLLASDFKDRVGTRRIPGKAVIVFRFDHYLNVYRDQIRPLMTARGFKATIAMNSRTWDAAQNNQVTPAEADAWTDVEFANHGAHHSDASTDAALYDTIALGQSELQAQLPNHAIDGFIVPGVGGTQYGGWGTGSTLTSFADYEAGRLILGHHAYSTGSGGSVNRKMDGQLRQGLSHYGIESRTFAPVKAAIDSAVASNSALTLMMHPDRLGTSGNISVADLTQIFDYVKALVDAGDVEVLTLGESLLADSTHSALAARLAALEYASGPRNITAMFPEITSGSVITTRAGRMVTTTFYGVRLNEWPSGSRFLHLDARMPDGFRPERGHLPMTPAENSGGVGSVRIAGGSGQVTFYGGSTVMTFYATLTYPTDDPVPVLPPGSAA